MYVILPAKIKMLFPRNSSQLTEKFCSSRYRILCVELDDYFSLFEDSQMIQFEIGNGNISTGGTLVLGHVYNGTMASEPGVSLTTLLPLLTLLMSSQ